MRRFIGVVLILLWFVGLSFLQADECTSFFTTQLRESLIAVRVDLKSVSKILSEVPEFRAFVEELLDDRFVPRNIKLVLKKSLETPGITVKELTDALRNSLEGELHEVRGFVNLNQSILTSSKKGQNKIRRYRIVEEAGAPMHVEVGIESDAHLTYFIHELAHIRFESFLRKNIKDLSKRFPDDMIAEISKSKLRPEIQSRFSGETVFVMNEELYVYLSERYSNLIEYQTYQKTYGRYYKQQSHYGTPTHSKGSVLRAQTGQLFRHYDVRDWRILAMKDRSLKNILLEGFDPKKHSSIRPIYLHDIDAIKETEKLLKASKILSGAAVGMAGIGGVGYSIMKNSEAPLDQLKTATKERELTLDELNSSIECSKLSTGSYRLSIKGGYVVSVNKTKSATCEILEEGRTCESISVRGSVLLCKIQQSESAIPLEPIHSAKPE